MKVVCLFADSIVNATSTWPLNSLHASAVLPTYEESLAVKHSSYPSQMTYFDTNRFLSHQRSPKSDTHYNLVERSVPSTKEDLLTSDYDTGLIRHVQSFDKVKKEDFTSRSDVPLTQVLKGNPDNASEKETNTILNGEKEAEEKTVVTNIKQEKVEPEQDDDSNIAAEIKGTKYEAIKKEEVSSSTKEKKIQNPSSKEVVNKVETKDELKTKGTNEQTGNDFSFLDWEDGIATLPGRENATTFTTFLPSFLVFLFIFFFFLFFLPRVWRGRAQCSIVEEHRV